MRTLRRRSFAGLTLLAGALLGAVLCAAPASAYPVDTGPLPPPTGTVTRGGTVGLTGGGFDSAGTVTITLQPIGLDLGTFPVNAQGVFTGSVTLPSDLPPGNYTLRATGAAAAGGTLVLSRSITIPSVSGRGGTRVLPVTGYPIGLLLAASGIALLIGVGAVALGARRRDRGADTAGNADGR